MLKTIHVNDRPYVCGRKKSELNLFPRFANQLSASSFNDADAIRAAAKSLHPIYAAVEDILGNDKYGVCTCAAALKMQAIFDCAAGREWRMPTLGDALWLYSQITNPPFDPATGDNDNGADLQAVLTFWQNHGLYKDGHGKIKAAYAVDGMNRREVEAALDQYGILYAGGDLASGGNWEKITGSGFTWSMDGPPNPNAGHCTWLYGRNEPGAFISTWGMEGTVDWAALVYYWGADQGGELFGVVPA